MLSFTIPLAPISKKNSMRIALNRKTGRPFILPSARYVEYERQAIRFVPKVKRPIDKAVNVQCLFYMPNHRKCDLTNLLEAVDDLMVMAGLLADDNYTIIESHDFSRVLYDKNNARTEVIITYI